MELKDYQSDVLADLEKFISEVVESGRIADSYKKFWHNKDFAVNHNSIGLHPYIDTVPGVPRVTAKVPTAGGKTFIACNAISTIFNNLPERSAKVVAWFVPSDTILEQTLKNLNDLTHPYRQRLNALFNNRVTIVDKEQALMGINISPTEIKENLTIFVLSAASFIEAKREDLPRVYRDNGYLEEYAKLFSENTRRVENAGETGLIQVLSYMNPLVIVDEAHNFTADLRVEMLRNVNPCFIYELTATPKADSNIITFIGAEKLKKANMVKLPVIVHNDRSSDAVISNAITMRQNLEKEAMKCRNCGGPYIRPIVLFQAQPRKDNDSETFEKIKNRLVSQYGIPEEQIKIKTANINQLKGVDLMAESCPVRFIITVNALKEGWDCPFAYILASIANRSSRVDVEQLLGRILRQPYTKKHLSTFLNMSYAFTSSDMFSETLNYIVDGLKASGFSSKDYRAPSFADTNNAHIEINPDEPAQVDNLFSSYGFHGVAEPEERNNQSTVSSPNDNTIIDTNLDEELSAKAKEVLYSNAKSTVSQIMESAQTEAEQYEAAVEEQNAEGSPDIPFELAEDSNLCHIREAIYDIAENLKLPQFCVPSSASQFEDFGLNLLDKTMLLEGFELKNSDKNILFDISDSTTRAIDIDENNDYALAQSRLREDALSLFRRYYMTLDTAGKVRELQSKIVAAINVQGITDRSLMSYVNSILEAKNNDELTSMAANLGSTIKAFKDKITELSDKYRYDRFMKLLEIGHIFPQETYAFPKAILLPETCPTLHNMLYRQEGSMNPFEWRLAERIADLDNVLFWHRNDGNKGFCINGFINHYPDFIVVTRSGRIVIIETKGSHLKNDDSEQKIELSRCWAAAAGPKYHYFMVFDTQPLSGAYSLNDFIDIFKNL